LIAEVGVNHEGSLDIARRQIFDAAESGADAVKFQTYRAKTLASRNSPAYWDLEKEPTTNQYELFKKHDKFWLREFEILSKYCEEAGITFCSTPFDIESAEFLNELMPFFKISSSDITNRPFIEYLTKFNKPIILSTGASYLSEIEEAVSWIKNAGNNELALLHCVLNYPTEDANANLGAISLLQRKFPDLVIGYSDHTIPKNMQTLLHAFLLGATVLEKHFTHDKSLPGNDHYHAMDKDDLKHFVALTDSAVLLHGNSELSDMRDQNKSRLNARRSVVAACEIKKGDVFTSENLTFKRPASGISAKHMQDVVGRVASLDVNEDEILDWKHVGELPNA
jgi:N-acetylneuraminate synthase